MEVKIIKKEIRKDNILTKLTLILLGIFILSAIFALATQIFPDFGIWIALSLSIFLIFSGFYYIDKGTRLRIVTWGMLATLVAGAGLFFVGLNILTKSLSLQ
ncbi:MAG: hypothetical protein O3B47_02530 [bacterium]|nr:hypothetical protein [bacterium]